MELKLGTEQSLQHNSAFALLNNKQRRQEMATNNTTAARESRRRKIVERGPDRLALITGRIQSIPSDPHVNNKPEEPDSSPPLNSHPDLPDQTTFDSLNGKDGAFGTVLPDHDPTIDTFHVGPPLHEHETSLEDSRAPALDVSNDLQSSLPFSTDQKSTVSTLGYEQPPQTRQDRFVTSIQISSAIVASERARRFCSVIIALLVVLSHLGFPLLGSSIIKSILSFRPLYLVLLSNVTLVLARLLFNNQRGFERTVIAEDNVPSSAKYDWAEQVSNILEVGLVMQKAIDAVFMDCSVYAIIIICGLSFV